MTDPVTVRRATIADACRVADLSGVLGYPVEPATVLQRLERVLARSEDVVLVAEHKGQVVGWLHGVEHELIETGRHCEILGLVVDSAHRRLGAGRRLVVAVEAWAVGRGLHQIGVRSNVVRSEAHQFYERAGYQRTKTQHSYRKQLQADGM